LLLLLFVRLSALGPAVQPKAANAWALLCKPPVWICSLVIFTITLPIALCQPLFEPYLTGEPFWLTPGGVGIVFGLVALVDTVSAVLTGGTSLLLGQLELIVLSLMMLIGGCFIIALGPKVYSVFLIGCFMTSLGMYPVLITVTALLLRICRTYGMDPKAYSEIIVSLVVTSLTLSAGLGSTFLGGMLGDAIGLRGAFLVCAFLCCPLPIIFLAGMHPSVIGRPLAPMASDNLDAQGKRRAGASAPGQAPAWAPAPSPCRSAPAGSSPATGPARGAGGEYAPGGGLAEDR